jgi:hypothetical protein
MGRKKVIAIDGVVRRGHGVDPSDTVPRARVQRDVGPSWRRK